MKNLSIGLGLCLFAGMMACGGEDITAPPAATAGKFSTASKINAFLDGKIMMMEGASIPSHPNGIDEDVNSGQATQCYHKVEMRPSSGRISINTQTGTLNGAPNVGDRGTCDHAMMKDNLEFTSTAVLFENVRDNGGCFDFTVTFPGFGQEGRGSINADGTEMILELFFKDRATGHRCDDGDVGDMTVTAAGMAFTGDARQTYSIE